MHKVTKSHPRLLGGLQPLLSRFGFDHGQHRRRRIVVLDFVRRYSYPD